MFRPRLRGPSALGHRLSRPQLQPATSAAAAAAAAAAPAAAAMSCRRIHYLPNSRHDSRVGVPGLLSAEGYDLAWTQHMSLMLGRLNQLIAGTDYETRSLKNIVLETARSPHMAAVFNHASMAHNTDFFFKQLRPASADSTGFSSGAPGEIPVSLRTAIEENFGSVETLRREFAATANAMFGPGFVWLVKASHLPQLGRGGDNLRLLTTYLAGSPYPGAHWRRQDVDMNTVGTTTSFAAGGATDAGGNVARQWLDKQAAAVSSSPSSSAITSSITSPSGSPVDRRPPGGIDVIPLLCLSTWEHVWLRDYGVGGDGYGGKAAFVDAWWNAIDWDAVAQMAVLTRPRLMT